ncbi:MAG: hypothetical protein OSJ74_08375, partial [Clostridia bacterium]|nr:hypothetical protein [Clostridia bacterium]
PTDKGIYTVVIKSNKASVVLSGKTQYTFEIIAATIAKEWNKDAKPYVLNLKYGQIGGVEYEIRDAEGNVVEYSELQAGNSYEIRAKIKESERNNYSFKDGTYETDWERFELKAEDMGSLADPNDPNNPNYPQKDEDEEPSNPENPPSGDASGNPIGGGTLDEILEKLKELPIWQIITGSISIIFIIVFLSKTASYEGKRKKLNKKAEKFETVYAAAPFLGLAVSGWTAIACVLMGLAVASLVIMLIAKSRYNKAEESFEEAKEEYQANKAEEERKRRDDDMQMMFMRMMGSQGANMGAQPQGAYMGGYGIGTEDIRGIISETVTALLPGVQQLLPQQASSNDDVIKSLVEEQKAMREVMQKLADKSTEKVYEREVAVASAVNEETVRQLIDKNDERFAQMMKNQEALISKLLERDNAPQVVAAVQPTEKIVEKIVEVPVEKIV